MQLEKPETCIVTDLVPRRFDPLRHNVTRRDRVHSDSERPEVDRHLPRQADDGSFTRLVDH